MRCSRRAAAWMVLAVGYWLIEERVVVDTPILGAHGVAVFFLSTLLAELFLISIRIAGPDGRLQPLQAVLFDAILPWGSPEIALARLGVRQCAAVARADVAALSFRIRLTV